MPPPALPIGPLRRAYYAWKALRLPWRNRLFIGFDLTGNTYWEFRDGLDTQRWRRIVRYPRSTHYSDIKTSPHWHQWLRHARVRPPSLAEQQADVLRQERTRLLAAEANARWEAKPRVMEDPAAAAKRVGLPSTEKLAKQMKQEKEKGELWGLKRPTAPGEEWQPAAWTPPTTSTTEKRDEGRSRRKP